MVIVEGMLIVGLLLIGLWWIYLPIYYIKQCIDDFIERNITSIALLILMFGLWLVGTSVLIISITEFINK